jgi:acyl-CoA dehydrogenase
MNIAFSEEQLLLKSQVRKLLEGECDSETVREVLDGSQEYAQGLWKSLCDMGLPGTAIDDEYGGASAGYLELCVVAEELGRAVAPVPFPSSIYLAAEVLKAAGSQEQKKSYLPRIASGESIGTVALDVAANLKDGALSGTLNDVPDGGVADLAIVLASPGGDGEAVLAIVELTDSSVTRTSLKTIDPTRNLANLAFDGTPAEVIECPGGAAAIVERVRNHGGLRTGWRR